MDTARALFWSWATQAWAISCRPLPSPDPLTSPPSPKMPPTSLSNAPPTGLVWQAKLTLARSRFGTGWLVHTCTPTYPTQKEV